MDQSPPSPTTPSSLTGHCRGLRIQPYYPLSLGPLVSQSLPILLDLSALWASVLRLGAMAVLILSLIQSAQAGLPLPAPSWALTAKARGDGGPAGLALQGPRGAGGRLII